MATTSVLSVPCDWRRPAVAGGYELHWDAKAAFGEIVPRPAASEIAAFYATEYYTHGTDTARRASSGPLHRLMRHLAWRFDRSVEPTASWWSGVLGHKPSKVLEIGCGDGSNLEIFRAIGHEVVGLEPDPAALAVAQRKYLRVFPGTAEEIPRPLGEDRFDAVVFMHVMEHTLDPAAAASNARRLLRNGGTCVVEVPNNACKGRLHFGAGWYWLDVPRHLNFFTAKSLVALMTRAGFEVVRVEYRGYNRQFAQDWIDAQEHIASTMDLKPKSMPDYWRYLAATAFASPVMKYDSVRLVARAV